MGLAPFFNPTWASLGESQTDTPCISGAVNFPIVLRNRQKKAGFDIRTQRKQSIVPFTATFSKRTSRTPMATGGAARPPKAHTHCASTSLSDSSTHTALLSDFPWYAPMRSPALSLYADSMWHWELNACCLLLDPKRTLGFENARPT